MYNSQKITMLNRKYQERNLQRHQSYCEKPSPMDIVMPKTPISKSENDIILPYQLANVMFPSKNLKPRRLDAGDRKPEQYYKRYDHDEVPVKDSSGKLNQSINITDSKLNAIETEALKDISEPLAPQSVNDTDVNLKIFKTTVQEILNNFFTNIKDFEDYKKRFYDLLRKDPHTSTEGMEEFIKEMIKHIVSQTSISNNSYKNLKGNSSEHSKKEMTTTNTVSSVKREYNPNRENNSTNVSSGNSLDSLDLFKLFINSNDVQEYARSEVLLNTRRPKNRHVTSAGDISNVFAQKLEFEGFIMQQMKSPHDLQDMVIPMKNTSPKMDLNIAKTESMSQRDFQQKDTIYGVIERENRKSFLSKICRFFCRKLRRYSIN